MISAFAVSYYIWYNIFKVTRYAKVNVLQTFIFGMSKNEMTINGDAECSYVLKFRTPSGACSAQ